MVRHKTKGKKGDLRVKIHKLPLSETGGEDGFENRWRLGGEKRVRIGGG